MFYILYGENAVMLDNFIEELMKSKDISDKIVYDYSECNIKDVIEECSYNDLFGSKKMVVLDNSVFLTSKGSLEDKTFDSYISSPNENTVLVFKVVCEKLDERKKLVKDLKSKSIVKEFKDLDKTNINEYINNYFDENDDKQEWFNKIKELAGKLGYASEVKEFKANPDKYEAHVGDVSTVLRIALTGRSNTPDMYEIMEIMGKDRIKERFEHAKKEL